MWQEKDFAKYSLYQFKKNKNKTPIADKQL